MSGDLNLQTAGFISGVTLFDNAVIAEAFLCLLRDCKFLIPSKLKTLAGLILNGVFLILHVVGAATSIDEILAREVSVFHIERG
jgi:hypothetical protein